MKPFVSLALSVAVLAVPTSAVARGGHGHGGHGPHGHHHHEHHHHHFHGHGGVLALPYWFYGPRRYCDPYTYPPDALIYDPQSGAVWVPGHSACFGAHQVWVPGHWEQLRPNS